MKSATRLFVALLLALAGLWLLADTLLPDPFGWFPFRGVFVQFSGAIAIGVMSMAMILAMRSRWLESRLNGLDKMYRLHKWLGITALVAAVSHWWFALGTKWMVGWGWLERPARGPRPEETLGLIEGFFRQWRGFAESVGEWAFYIAAALMILALVKRFPYHWFKKTHTLLALGYLALVFHSVVLIKFEYWTQPIGWLLGLLMLGGSISGVLILAGQVGRSRKVKGHIEKVEAFPEMRTVATTVLLDNGWDGHCAGQFAFLKTGEKEAPHPFTIASAWNPQERRLTFISKALGDHTTRMLDELRAGQAVTVEGPYGCFDFRDQQPRQVWIGAGIGITPFIARMKELARNNDQQSVDLYHCVADVDEKALEKLQEDARAAGINLHLVVSGIDERLTAARIMEQIRDWKNASFWFCGPTGFGKSLKRDMTNAGLDADLFHQELFEMR
ncbi:ferredoxin reductase family protein [Parathalassolituus penaei]|uniref:Ferric reductase-like transmembrane domain-containing protein n=1 Tax=Parathalassolituus penaei TaxID=2997323 RepID=A0A9X3EED3_9GAMM|nr:ferric reductase-like transmembrane domain-containing protein [Parathalassolituus penaei]MCY0965155.1 ferric reductase-like transmembrane domain-containing protein [Parathalassolituus penaei]